METWDKEEYINEESQALIGFEENGIGPFQFGYVQGNMDWQPTTRDSETAYKEMTWPINRKS